MSCFLCNGPGKSNKEGRNLNTNSGLSELKYHFAFCVYLEVRKPTTLLSFTARFT